MFIFQRGSAAGGGKCVEHGKHTESVHIYNSRRRFGEGGGKCLGRSKYRIGVPICTSQRGSAAGGGKCVGRSKYSIGVHVFSSQRGFAGGDGSCLGHKCAHSHPPDCVRYSAVYPSSFLSFLGISNQYLHVFSYAQ